LNHSTKRRDRSCQQIHFKGSRIEISTKNEIWRRNKKRRWRGRRRRRRRRRRREEEDDDERGTHIEGK